MFSEALRVLPIKDLKDLSVLLVRRGSIDMQVLKDLKKCFFYANDRGGQAPALRLKKRPLYRRARACPSPCLGRGDGVGWRSVFA